MIIENSEKPSSPPCPELVAAGIDDQLPGKLVGFEAIRCTLSSCRCDCFQPGKAHVRTCDTCKHGWVAHALDKLGFRSMYQMGVQVEVVQPSVVFDIASLMLYGSQGTPIRLKILLDRLFSVLQHEEVLQVLHGFGWSYEDYARGYILQDPSGQVLDKWNICTREEEQVVLQQFLRFGETKAIAQEIILQDARENHSRHLIPNPKSESDIKKFLERNTGPPTSSSSTGNSPTAGSTPLGSFETRYPIRPFPGFPGLMPNHKLFSAATALGGFTLPLTSTASATSTPKESPRKEEKLNNSLIGPGSPLSRLQTMQPFDYRRERNTSPVAVSPIASSERSVPTTPHGSSSPQNLSISSAGSMISPPMARHQMNSLKHDIKPFMQSPVKSFTKEMPIRHDYSAPLDFSIKDNSNHSSNISPRGPLSIAETMAQGRSVSMPYDDHQSRNMRKVVPTIQRRNYSPTPGYGGTLVSPSGKKRVLCTACNKTFCDKGALKIHYSAVHLKEMHKCTVEGCHMMFSSRRSRNRHSANPNPKLHMPQNRRKLPDGAIVLEDKNPPPHLPTSLPGLMHPTGPIAMTSSAINAAGALEIKPITVMPMAAVMQFAGMPHLANMKHHMAFMDGEHYESSSPSKLARLNDDEDGDDEYNDDGDDDMHHTPRIYSSPLGRSMKINGDVIIDDNGHNEGRRNVSKRKSVVPTRCAPQIVEDMYVMSDDNSMDGIEVSEGEDPILGSVKSPSSLDGTQSQEDEMEEGESHSAFYKVAPSSKNKHSSRTASPDDLTSSEKHPHGNSNGESLHVEDNYNDHSPIPSPARSPSATYHSHQKAPQDLSSNNKENKDENIQAIKSSSGGSNKDIRDKQPGYSPSGNHAMHPGIVGLDGIYEKVLDMSTTSSNSIQRLHDDVINSKGNKDDLSNGNREDHDDMMEDSLVSMATTMEEEQEEDDFDDSIDFPVDQDDPKRCTACGKQFQNHFSLKTHYQNVHLKLMHTCTVEGCNAAFPSKRSRDRHSSNLNLHRKLLSTTSLADGKIGHKSPTAVTAQSLRDEFLARIYDPQQLSGAFAAVMQQHQQDYHALLLAAGSNGLAPTATSLIGDDNMSDFNSDAEEDGNVNSGHIEEHIEEKKDIMPSTFNRSHNTTSFDSHNNNPPPAHQHKGFRRPSINSGNIVDEEYEKFSPLVEDKSSIAGLDNISIDEDNNEKEIPVYSRQHHITMMNNKNVSLMNFDPDSRFEIPEDSPRPDPNGDADCHICGYRFRDNLVLKEHFEKVHPKEMFHCTMKGCDKIFSTRKSRNRHSQNDNLHRHLPSTPTALNAV